jgi:hypothetical protein
LRVSISDLDRYEAGPDEHECPTPLQRRVDEFDAGGMFWSPAGRWETIAETGRAGDSAIQVRITTDHTGQSYGWLFWPSDRMPYLPGYLADRHRGVVVGEYGNVIEARISDTIYLRRYTGGGHALVSAIQVRGRGWQIQDRPAGDTVEQASAPSKARARTEVTRRARAHAKALGLPLWKAER